MTSTRWQHWHEIPLVDKSTIVVVSVFFGDQLRLTMRQRWSLLELYVWWRGIRLLIMIVDLDLRVLGSTPWSGINLVFSTLTLTPNFSSVLRLKLLGIALEISSVGFSSLIDAGADRLAFIDAHLFGIAITRSESGLWHDVVFTTLMMAVAIWVTLWWSQLSYYSMTTFLNLQVPWLAAILCHSLYVTQYRWFWSHFLTSSNLL